MNKNVKYGIIYLTLFYTVCNIFAEWELEKIDACVDKGYTVEYCMKKLYRH